MLLAKNHDTVHLEKFLEELEENVAHQGLKIHCQKTTV